MRVRPWPRLKRVKYSLPQQIRTKSNSSSDIINQSERVKSKTTSHSADLSRKIIFSGIQPTGIPHLGNYLGALRQWVKLQDEWDEKIELPPQCFFSVVDLHALTEPQDPKRLLQHRHETLAALLAIGLSPEKSAIFFQSEVSFHAELMWILSTVASTGYLSRMTQWKSKLELPSDASLEQETARNKLRLGLFSYPVLQAADILLYRTTHVPIGADQLQHLEFTRSLAQSFNHLYPITRGPRPTIFHLPQAILSPHGSSRVMSLRDPTRKMSKSDRDPKSRILITDSADDIALKIRHALTDSLDSTVTYDPTGRPGVSNLIEILFHIVSDAHDSSTPTDYTETHLRSVSIQALKSLVTSSVTAHLSGIRDRFLYLTRTVEGGKEVEAARRRGQENATRRAAEVMHDVRRAVGLSSSE